MADLDGQWRTRTDIGRLGRTLADSDGLVLQRAGLSSEIAKQRGILESRNRPDWGFGSRTGFSRILPDRNRWFQSDKKRQPDFAGFCRKISFLSTLNLHRAFLAACIRDPILF